MKKLFAIIAVALAASCAFVQSAKAEDKIDEGKAILQNNFGKNWEIKLGVGVQTYLAEYYRDLQFKDAICPTVDLSIDKWVSPSWGFGIAGTFATYKGLYTSQSAFSQPGDASYAGGFKLAKGSYINPFAKVDVNFCNLFGGYKADRIFNLTGYLGAGVIMGLTNVNYNCYTASPTINAGLGFQWAVSKHVDIDLNVRGAFAEEHFNGIAGDFPLDGMLGATVGISYKFGFVNLTSKKGEKNSFAYVPLTYVLDNSDYVDGKIADAVADQKAADDAKLNAANNELKAAKEALAKAQAENVVLANKKYNKAVDFASHIGFAIDSKNITKREKINVMKAAAFIKAYPDQTFTVTGYADKQTGSPKYNQNLSQKRAEAVRDLLVELGVNPAQLVVKAEGGVDCLYFNAPSYSRSAVITVNE